MDNKSSKRYKLFSSRKSKIRSSKIRSSKKRNNLKNEHNENNENNETNKDDNMVKALKIILFKSDNIDQIVSNMQDLYVNSIDNMKYELYKSHFIPYNDIGGKSGAVLGSLSNQVNMIMKMNTLKKSEMGESLLIKGSKSGKCILVNNKFNEVLINLIFKNIEHFSNINSIEKKLIKKHILEIDDYGFTEKTFYITMPLIGFNYTNPITKKEKYLTNMRELLVNNHIPHLKNIFSSDDKSIMELYDSFMANSLKGYIMVLKIFQKHLKYINNDTKLNNVFIRHVKKKNPELNPLRNRGIVVDFVPLLSDLEKSIIEVNGYKIITYSNSPRKTKILKVLDIGLIYKVRYECESSFTKVCQKLSIYDFDILLLVFDFYILLLSEIRNIFDYLPLTNQLIMNELNLNEIQFVVLKNLLINGKYKIGMGGSFHLGEIIKKYCMFLNKL
jgi:hypothetical protein